MSKNWKMFKNKLGSKSMVLCSFFWAFDQIGIHVDLANP